MSTNIYILKLQGGRYYVGKSDNPMKRYQEHLNGSGSAWTRKYKPIGLQKIIENASPFDEDRYVKEYMSKHGIEKVRGGAYIQEELPDFQELALVSELRGARDLCINCGCSGHWAKDCYGKRSPTQVPPRKKRNECDRCGRSGHSEEICHAKYHRDGDRLESDDDSLNEECMRCGRLGHGDDECYAKWHVDGNKLDSEDEFEECGRCRRSGHTEKKCHAKRDVDGNDLDSEDSWDQDSDDEDEWDDDYD
jgi:predicted GIY-YIG superfamily endonuclease